MHKDFRPTVIQLIKELGEEYNIQINLKSLELSLGNRLTRHLIWNYNFEWEDIAAIVDEDMITYSSLMSRLLNIAYERGCAKLPHNLTKQLLKNRGNKNGKI